MTARDGRALVVSALVVCLLPPVARAATIDQLGWLAGCWEARGTTRLVEEQWMKPRGGLMLGMARTLERERLVEFEQVRIRQHGTTLVYEAQPSGQPPASFEAIEVSDSAVVFSNPAHDFPQRIIYRRRADGSLLARIEGTVKGRERGIDFPMKRAGCP